MSEHNEEQCEFMQMFQPLLDSVPEQHRSEAHHAVMMIHDGEPDGILPMLMLILRLTTEVDALRVANEALAGLVADKL